MFTNSGADPGFPVGGAPTLIGVGANLQHRCFSVKTYVKTKEFGPVGGGGRRKLLYVDPPLQFREKSIFLSELAIKFVEFCEIIDCSCTMIYRVKGGMICFSYLAGGFVIRAEPISKKNSWKIAHCE